MEAEERESPREREREPGQEMERGREQARVQGQGQVKEMAVREREVPGWVLERVLVTDSRELEERAMAPALEMEMERDRELGRELGLVKEEVLAHPHILLRK